MRLRHVHLARFIKVPREGSGESYSLKERTLSQTPKGCSCFLVVVVLLLLLLPLLMLLWCYKPTAEVIVGLREGSCSLDADLEHHVIDLSQFL